MEVQQYIFQSPFTSSVQVGRVDPSSVKSEEKPQEEATETKVQEQDNTLESLDLQTSSAAAINVATSTSNQGVSQSLEKFSALNALAQAQTAFKA